MNNQNDRMRLYHQANLSEDRLVCGGMIAISLVILQSFISLQKLDTPEFISTIAFSIGIPALSLCLLITSMANIKEGDTYPGYTTGLWSWNEVKAVIYLLVFMVGVFATFTGITAAIWHLSQQAGIIFFISGLISYPVYVYLYRKRILEQ